MPKFVYPLDNIYITQKFGERPEYYKKYGMNGHNGIDFRTKFWDSPMGRRYCVAVADGEVSAVVLTPGSGYGNHVKIRHSDGSETLYAHLNRSYVFKGQKVKQGERIALTNNTGDSSAAHLHFGYKPANPNQGNGFLGSEDPIKFFSEDVPVEPAPCTHCLIHCPKL